MGKIILLGLVLLFLISIANAEMSCTTNDLSVSYKEGETTSRTFSCTNLDLNNSVHLNKIGQYFSTSPSTPITFSPGELKQITLNFENAPPGTYNGLLWFDDGSEPVSININITQQEQPLCNIDVFPTILTNIKIKQGEQKTRNIQLSVPICYKSPVNIQGIALQTDEQPIQLGELSIGTIHPGNSIIIPLEIDAEGVSTGQYSDTLQFLLYNDEGEKINVPSVSVSVLVTAGIQPISNFNFSSLPACSLDSIELNLNSTYRLTCTQVSNIQIRPVIDTKYLRGVGVQETSSQYIYEFKPVLLGKTTIKAEFWYKNAPIGNPFEQDIRITPSGSTPVSGVTMRFNFYQNGVKKNKDNLESGETVVLMTDNSTDSVIQPFTLYLNGNLINNTFNLEPDKTYELRASAEGYIDSVINFTVSKSALALTLFPSKSEYEVGDVVNVSSNYEDAIVLFDDEIIGPIITLNKEGKHVIRIEKEGYLPTEKNITVREKVSILSITPNYEDWSKGKDIRLKLSKSVSWNVEFYPFVETDEGNLLSNDYTIIANGTGDYVNFNINKFGKYVVKSGNDVIALKTIEKSGFNWNKKIWFMAWYWWVLLIFAVIGILIYRRIPPKKEEGLVFAPKVSEG